VKISVKINVYNESHNIAAACDSVAWADERIVVDSCSTDETAAIAARLGARVVSREWPGYVDQKIAAAADSTPSGDSLRLAVLAALNIADELFRMREANRARDSQIAERASELEQLVDRVLMAS